jgi:hypothetical protein
MSVTGVINLFRKILLFLGETLFEPGRPRSHIIIKFLGKDWEEGEK